MTKALVVIFMGNDKDHDIAARLETVREKTRQGLANKSREL